MEAATWHQLGKVYHARRQWDEAERHYREAARISEERGHPAAAAQTWSQLAVSQEAGKPGRGRWYRKALEVDRQIGNPAAGTPLTTSPTCFRTSRVASSRPDNWPRRRWPSRRGSTPRRRTPGRATASSRASSIKRREPARTANRGPRWKCRHATIAKLQRHAPIIFATLARIGESPSYRQGRDSRTTGPLPPHGQAVRSGRCVRS